jgi:hypothetical protein
VFHAVLVMKLDSDGALTLRELKQRLFWFGVKMTDNEVDQLVASAARHAIVVPLANAGPGLGEEEIEQTRWIPTDRGRELPSPRGTGFEDFGSLLPVVLRQLQQAIAAWFPVLVAALAAVGFSASLGAGGRAAGAVTLLVFLVVWCGYGIRGERDLAAAAEIWPRFREARPKRCQWQTSRWRAETLVGGAVSAVALFLAALVVLELRTSLVLVGAGLITLFVTWIIYRLRILPLFEAWQAEEREHSGG